MTSNVALIGLARDLKKREDSGKPIRIGLVGCGEMGTDLLTGVAHMDGIEVAAVSTRTPERVLDAAKIAYDETGHAKEVSNASEMTAAIEEGKIAATDDLDMLLKNELVDVIVDATGYPRSRRGNRL